MSSDLSEAPVRQESTFGFPDFVVAYSAGRNFAWTASPDAQKTRSMIAVSRRVDSRSWSRRTSRCSGRSPAAPAAERQGVRRTRNCGAGSDLGVVVDGAEEAGLRSMNFISGKIVDGARPGEGTHGRRSFVDGILYHCRCAVEQAVEADGRPQTAAHRLTARRWTDLVLVVDFGS